MPKTSFVPSSHGFRFLNEFQDKALGTVPMYGACGGMSYAALDYFMAGRAIPSSTRTPSNSSLLGRYIWDRHWDSTVRSWHAAKHAELSACLDDQALARTAHAEFGRLCAAIDLGTTVVLGLIGWGPVPSRNHQVVAYGYDERPQTIYIYDNRIGPEELCLVNDGRSAHWYSSRSGPPTGCSSGDGRWRGWFVESGYSPRAPVSLRFAPRGTDRNRNSV